MPKTKEAIAGEIHWSERPLVPIKVASELLAVSRSGIYRLEAAGKLSFGKIGSRTVVRVDSLIRYLDSVEDWTPSQQGAAARKARAERAAAGW